MKCISTKEYFQTISDQIRFSKNDIHIIFYLLGEALDGQGFPQEFQNIPQWVIPATLTNVETTHPLFVGQTEGWGDFFLVFQNFLCVLLGVGGEV